MGRRSWGGEKEGLNQAFPDPLPSVLCLLHFLQKQKAEGRPDSEAVSKHLGMNSPSLINPTPSTHFASWLCNSLDMQLQHQVPLFILCSSTHFLPPNPCASPPLPLVPAGSVPSSTNPLSPEPLWLALEKNAFLFLDSFDYMYNSLHVPKYPIPAASHFPSLTQVACGLVGCYQRRIMFPGDISKEIVKASVTGSA